MEGVPTTFTSAMNGSLAKDIMERKKASQCGHLYAQREGTKAWRDTDRILLTIMANSMPRLPPND